MSTFTPGAVTTVGELEVGDTVFLKERSNATGLPTPSHPATVAELVPLPGGRVQVRVKSAPASGAEPRLLGQLPATRQFRRAVLEP